METFRDSIGNLITITGITLEATPTIDIGDVTLLAGTAAIGKVSHDKSGIGHGVTTSTSVGTAVVLAASTVAKVVIIQAQTDNTGAVAVGGSGVLATVATGTGVLLYAGDSIALEIDNLNDVYFDVTISGDGVRYTYLS